MHDPDELRARQALLEQAADELASVAASDGALAQADGLRRAEHLLEDYGLDSWRPTQTLLATIRLRRAVFLWRLDEDAQALAALDEIVQWSAASQDDNEREVAADALLAKVNMLRVLERSAEAADMLRALVERFGTENHDGIQHTVALAQRTLVEQADTWESTIAAFEALQRAHGDLREGPRAWAVVASAGYYVKALIEVGRTAEAKAVLERFWDHYRDTTDLKCRRALARLRLLALRLLTPPDAAAQSSEIIDWLAPDETDPEITDVAAAARVRKASALRAEGDSPAALAVVEDLLSRFADTAQEETIAHLAWAQVEQGLLLEDLGRPAEAIAAWRSTRRFLDALGDRDYLRLKVAEALDHAAATLAADTPAPTDDRQGRDGVSVKRSKPVEQRPAEASEIAYAAAVGELADLFDIDTDPAMQHLVSRALYNLGDHQRHRLHVDEALATYDRLARRYLGATDSEVELTVAKGLMNTSFAQMVLLGRFPEAMETYNVFFERYGNHTSAEMRQLVSKMASGRVACANHLAGQGLPVSYGEHHEALDPTEVQAAETWQDDAIAAEERGDHASALALLGRILAAHGASDHPEWRRRSLDALVRTAWSLKKLGRGAEAITVCDDALARYGSDLSMEMEKDLAVLLSYKAVELDKLGRHDEELVTYDETIRRWSNNNVAALRKRVSNARLCKGITLKDLGRHDEAVAAYQQALVHAGDELVEVARDGVTAANDLGVLLRRLGRPAEAIEVHELALRHGRRDDPKLRVQVGMAHVGLGRAHATLGHLDEALAAMDAALATPPGTISDSLRADLAKERAEVLAKRRPPGLFGRLFSLGKH